MFIASLNSGSSKFLAMCFIKKKKIDAFDVEPNNCKEKLAILISVLMEDMAN